MHSQRSAAGSKDGHFILLCASPCWGILETNNNETPSHFATGAKSKM
jgi:hypothetical protein